jgi:hypothetical protein
VDNCKKEFLAKPKTANNYIVILPASKQAGKILPPFKKQGAGTGGLKSERAKRASTAERSGAK